MSFASIYLSLSFSLRVYASSVRAFAVPGISARCARRPNVRTDVHCVYRSCVCVSREDRVCARVQVWNSCTRGGFTSDERLNAVATSGPYRVFQL